MNEATATQTADVVITGYVASTSLADDADDTWRLLCDGVSGIGELSDEFVSTHDLPVRIGGKLELLPADHLDRVEIRRTSFVEQIALILVRRLWREAGLDDMDRERLAVSIGTGLGGGDALMAAVDTMRAHGHRKVSPMAVPMIMPNGSAALIGIETGARGGVHTTVSACSSGSEAIAHGWRLIASGEADVVVAGGLEGPIDAVPIASFSAMRAMSTNNAEPEQASRPFDRDRNGFVFGEAGALLVLENEAHARSRNAPIHARILGAGITSDAHHIVAPTPTGEGAARAMRKAIRTSGLTAADFTHVNAHATSTSIGDASEASAITAVTRAASVYAPKSALGHSIGAVGAVEAILTALTVKHAVVPPTLNFHNPDPGTDLDIVAGTARQERNDYALSNSIGFGGHNVTLAIGRP